MTELSLSVQVSSRSLKTGHQRLSCLHHRLRSLGYVSAVIFSIRGYQMLFHLSQSRFLESFLSGTTSGDKFHLKSLRRQLNRAAFQTQFALSANFSTVQWSGLKLFSVAISYPWSNAVRSQFVIWRLFPEDSYSTKNCILIETQHTPVCTVLKFRFWCGGLELPLWWKGSFKNHPYCVDFLQTRKSLRKAGWRKEEDFTKSVKHQSFD